jgi:hypothetical protein
MSDNIELETVAISSSDESLPDVRAVLMDSDTFGAEEKDDGSVYLSDIEALIDSHASSNADAELESVNIPPDSDDEDFVDDPELDENEVLQRIKNLPSPKVPSFSYEDSFFSILCAFLKENGQDMETLGLLGPPSADPVGAEEETFRKCHDTNVVKERAEKQKTSWAEIKQRQLLVKGKVHKNHLTGRLDFGGPGSSSYRYEARKAGE